MGWGESKPIWVYMIVARLKKGSMREIKKQKLVYDAQAYQIAKGIGELAPVLNGKIDLIILTGGVANSKRTYR